MFDGPGQSGGVVQRLQSWGSQSVWVLVAANALVAVQALFSEHGAESVVLVYWLETVLIGLLNVPKIWMAQESRPAGRFGVSLFFLVHYGFFCGIQGFFMHLLITREATLEALLTPALIGNALLLAGSHVFSFIKNYVGRGEYKTVSAEGMMFRPYPRVVVMQIVVIGGAALIAKFPFGPALILIALKTAVDVMMHKWERRSLQPKDDPLLLKRDGAKRIARERKRAG